MKEKTRKRAMKINKLYLWFIKNRKTIMKIEKIMIILLIPLLLLAVVIIGYVLVTGKIEGVVRKIFTTLFLIAILYFVYILFLLLTKYKKEFELNDKELKAKWKYLPLGYKRFLYEMSIFGLVFFLLMIIFGLTEVFLYKNDNGGIPIVIGTSLLVSEIRRIRKLRSWGRF